MTALLSDLNAALGAYSSETTDLVLKANESSFINKKITYSVVMRNFLNMNRTGSITILRENKELPRAILPRALITSTVSRQIKVRGKFIFRNIKDDVDNVLNVLKNLSA